MFPSDDPPGRSSAGYWPEIQVGARNTLDGVIHLAGDALPERLRASRVSGREPPAPLGKPDDPRQAPRYAPALLTGQSAVE